MGLDMFVWQVPEEDAIDDFSFRDQKNGPYEFAYWRKNHDLHGWFFSLAKEKGFHGYADEFNCVKIRIEESDLERLEEDLKANALPETRGFFFGNQPYDEDQQKEDLSFVENARKAIQNGSALYYDSWW